MQLLILSLLVAVASATYPSYYSGYGGYGSGLYGHSYGSTGGHVSYVLGDHGSDYAYSHAPSVIPKSVSKINFLSSSGAATKTHFPTEFGIENKTFATEKPDIKENIPVFPKEVSKNETDSNLPSDVDWVDISSKSDDKVTENGNEKKSSTVGAVTKKPTKVETNQGNSGSSIHTKGISTSTKKGASTQTPKEESFQSSKGGDSTTSTDSSHEPVNEFVTSVKDESKFDISEKLTLPKTIEQDSSTSGNRFVPVPDQDYEDFASKMSEPENIKETYKKQSNVELLKDSKSSAAQFFPGFLDSIPIISRSPRKTSTFEGSSLSSLVSSSDISSFETVDIPLPYYYYKRNQRGELYQHEPTLEYIPNIANF